MLQPGVASEHEPRTFAPPDASAAAEVSREAWPYTVAMLSRHRLAEIASLLADPSRAGMLSALWDGRARPAGELARHAGVTAATASMHLSKLLAAGLVRVQVSGRHRYFRLAGPEVGEALEALARLVPSPRRDAAGLPPERRALQRARLCYDHLAGALGVAVTEALASQRALVLEAEGLRLGVKAAPTFAKLGLDLAAFDSGRRPLVRTCIDWTERREHVAGALGAAIASEFLERDWIRRERGVRSVLVTTLGRRELRRWLGIRWD